ncbi:DUF2339 domain-containing protein [Arthrobacter sp. 24S4-2]|uniref:DUF2339 domain-containing protein n=1 Tax=Arthrobacter sp. 24S4-2 TaxID=2575374 RepID=UPI0010C787A6|nr:DUF2339 domain-containing protein [Arthrobacter sp. 24S4-2]QCO99414.1 DUF2339 domain-containing protein [Arthrobacter sp. 24S4-2]
MWSAFLTLLLVIAAVLLIASRHSIRQLKAAAGEAYRSGFMAGHVQGWHDANLAGRMPQQVGAEAPLTAAAGPAVGWPAFQPAFAPAFQPSFPPPFPPAGAEAETALAGPPRAPAVPAGQPATHVPAPAHPVHEPGSDDPVSEEPAVQEPPVDVAQFEVSPAELLARKEKRERQNINVTLYAAGLLLVAAGTLFVGTSLPAVFRFAGVCLITALFYGAGIVLHAKAPRLRPAAVAFAGTGLALVPVAGLAMYNFAVQDGPLAWLLTSVIGTLAYVAAAIRLESRVLVYLSLTFVVSTAWSGVSVVGASLVWYFAAMIGFAVAMTVVTLVKPRWIPPLFLRPVMLLDPFVVPAVAVAATVMPLRLDRGEFALIMALCGAYFALAALVPSARHRLPKTFGARAALTLSASAWAWHLTGNVSWALVTAGSLLAIQSVLVAAAASWLQRWCPAPGGLQHWQADSLSTFGTQTVLVYIMLLPASAGPEELQLWAVLACAVTAMIIAVRSGGAAEWAPAAALVTGVIAGAQLGPWLVFNVIAAATLFWAARSAGTRSPLRPQLILAARIAGTLAVPALTSAVMEGSGDALAAAVFALSLALVLQQLASAAAAQAEASALAPIPTLAGFTAAGIVDLVALSITDSTAGNVLLALALGVQLVASLAVGTVLFRPDGLGASWQPTAAEALPLAVFGAVVITAYTSASPGLGNGLLLLVVLHLVVSALRSTAVIRRWSYWWMARGAATVLLLASYRQFQDSTGPIVFGGQEVTFATVLIVALGLQLVFPLAATVRDRAPDAVVADVALILVLQTGTLAAALILPSTVNSDGAWDWQRTVALTIMAFGAAASGYVFRDLAAAAGFAPSTLAVLLVCSVGRLTDVELLLGIFALFSAVMVVAVEPRHGKGAYFAAGRLLTAALAMVFSYDISDSGTAVSLTFAGVLAFQYVIRWLMRHRLEQVPFQQGAVWFTLGAQTVMPALYVIQGSGVSAPHAAEGDGALSSWSCCFSCLVPLPRTGCSPPAVHYTCPSMRACSPSLRRVRPWSSVPARSWRRRFSATTASLSPCLRHHSRSTSWESHDGGATQAVCRRLPRTAGSGWRGRQHRPQWPRQRPFRQRTGSPEPRCWSWPLRASPRHTLNASRSCTHRRQHLCWQGPRSLQPRPRVPAAPGEHICPGWQAAGWAPRYFTASASPLMDATSCGSGPSFPPGCWDWQLPLARACGRTRLR